MIKSLFQSYLKLYNLETVFCVFLFICYNFIVRFFFFSFIPRKVLLDKCIFILFHLLEFFFSFKYVSVSKSSCINFRLTYIFKFSKPHNNCSNYLYYFSSNILSLNKYRFPSSATTIYHLLGKCVLRTQL